MGRLRPQLGGVVLLIAGSGVIVGCGTTIPTGHAGLKYISLDEPALRHEQKPEGFYWQWPWNDIIIYDVRLRSRDEDVSVLTADDLHVRTTATVTFRPHPKKLYQLHTEIGHKYYKRVIRPLFTTLVRAEFALHKHNNLARDSMEIERRVLAHLRRRLAKLPLEIAQVSIKHIHFDPTVTQSISGKLAMEQRAHQKRFELEIATRDAEIARTKARGESDSVEIRAKGDARAIVLKGRAQAEAQKKIGKTLTPKYLRYKAFDGDATRYYFVPVGKNGMPLIINTGDGRRPSRRRR